MTTTSLLLNFKIIVLAVVLFVISGITFASAQSAIPVELELNGYAWSSNIGWISLNCRTGGVGRTDICATSNYRVEVATNGNISGYGWSPNIGWVRFGGLSGFPTGANTYTNNASVTGTYPNLSLRGWARACSSTRSNPNFCGNMNINQGSGGWDGWISLAGRTPRSTWGISTQNLGSPQYAWGSDVVGWIDMSSRVTFLSPTTLTGTGCTITTAGQSTCNGRLTWSFSSEINNPTIVRTSPTSPTLRLTGATGANQTVLLQLGSNTFAARSGNNGSNITTQTLSAICGGNLITTSGACQPRPPVTVTITNLTSNPSIVRRGGTSVISWQLSTPPVAGQCALSGPGFANVDIAGRSNYTTPALNATSLITLNCGANVRDVTIIVVPAFNEV